MQKAHGQGRAEQGRARTGGEEHAIGHPDEGLLTGHQRLVDLGPLGIAGLLTTGSARRVGLLVAVAVHWNGHAHRETEGAEGTLPTRIDGGDLQASSTPESSH
jgi:hypothetical protein